MPRHRQPLSKARLTGADRKDPARYRGRSEPVLSGRALGAPPAYLDAHAKEAWALLADELPWLTFEDRGLVEATACQRAAVMTNAASLSTGFVRAYQRSLSSLGATPVDRQRVAWKPDDDETDPFSFLSGREH